MARAVRGLWSDRVRGAAGFVEWAGPWSGPVRGAVRSVDVSVAGDGAVQALAFRLRSGDSDQVAGGGGELVEEGEEVGGGVGEAQ